MAVTSGAVSEITLILPGYQSELNLASYVGGRDKGSLSGTMGAGSAGCSVTGRGEK